MQSGVHRNGWFCLVSKGLKYADTNWEHSVSLVGFLTSVWFCTDSHMLPTLVLFSERKTWNLHRKWSTIDNSWLFLKPSASLVTYISTVLQTNCCLKKAQLLKMGPIMNSRIHRTHFQLCVLKLSSATQDTANTLEARNSLYTVLS